MPVLTCPFAPIPAFAISDIIPSKSLVYPGIGRTTQLTIKPTATETWNVEGVSISFLLKMGMYYVVNETAAYEALEKQLASLVALTAVLTSINTTALEIFEVSKSKEDFKALQEATAAVKSNEAAEHAIAKEIAELGVKGAREGFNQPSPINIQLRLYARGNELIWDSGVSPIRIVQELKVTREEVLTIAKAQVVEVVNTHEQFDDPVEITERENLTLEVLVIGPPQVQPLGYESGPLTGSGTIEPIQSTVNYSRSVSQ